MSKTTIGDTRIRVKPTEQLLRILDTYKNEISEIPSNIAQMLKANGHTLPAVVETLQVKPTSQQPLIDIKLISSIRERKIKSVKADNNANKSKKPQDASDEKDEDNDSKNIASCLFLDDLHWLNEFLERLRKEQGLQLYLYELLEKSSLILPENDVIERNPVLEARCEKLRQEQQNREYMKMTKSVDAVLKHYPEDTIAYQIKSINKQIIAVFQFVVSVVTGFVFGFLGLELIFGGLDFGLRLLLGIMFALIIALAEIYFLAKKLNEYDEITMPPQNVLNHSPAKNKVHAD